MQIRFSEAIGILSPFFEHVTHAQSVRIRFSSHMCTRSYVCFLTTKLAPIPNHTGII